MKWIGLTGGIATGKSTVKKLLEGLGYPVIDADLISHEITQTGREGYSKILSHFGKDILQADQSLDRKALGQIVFNDYEKRVQLEEILHPLIQDEVHKQKNFHFNNKANLCFYDVPLLFEKNLQKNFDLVVLVWCDPNIQKLRLAARNHFSDAEIESRISSQKNMSFKIKNANYCVDNSTDVVGLEKQVHSLVQTIG